MPTIKHPNKRQEFVRVYRPHGTKYVQIRNGDLIDGIQKAQFAFVREFGYAPRQDKTVFEVLGVTGDWCIDMYEVDWEQGERR